MNIFIYIILLSVFSTSLFSAELMNADEIARHINSRDEGIAVSRFLTMEMTDKRGKQRIRKTHAFRKYYDDEKRTAIFYLEPKSIKDTAFLTYDYQAADKDDDQWLYLPALRKVRRISASDRGDYFLGTDFTYEDIKLETRISIEDYSRQTLGEDEVDGFHCLLIESKPVTDEIAAELGYSKVEQCVDDQIWMVRQSKMWDLNGNPLKTIHSSDIRQVQGIWTQHTLEVVNHKTGHQSKFVFSDVQYDKEINDNLFTKNTLKRGL